MNKADVTTFLTQFDEFFNGEIVGKKKYLRDLSKGNQKKAGIVAALMGNPQVIILDEPFANLDPTTQIRLKTIIKSLTENRDITVLISSHDLTHVTEVCERIVVLDKGIVVKDIETSAETLHELESYFSV
jgi:ABC-2 type transport system ATP-binding protein